MKELLLPPYRHGSSFSGDRASQMPALLFGGWYLRGGELLTAAVGDLKRLLREDPRSEWLGRARSGRPEGI